MNATERLRIVYCDPRTFSWKSASTPKDRRSRSINWSVPRHLLASLAYTLEHDLAFGAAPNPRCSEDWGEPCFDDRSDSDRWTVAKEHVNASAD